VNKFKHHSLKLLKDKPLIYTAASKHLFYFRMFISKYVLEQGGVPLNPFMIFDYFLAGLVSKDLVREGNNNIVKRADEIWVFGLISNGVLSEIQIAKSLKKTIKYFKIEKPHKIVECKIQDVELEAEVKDFRDEL
jgi:hypothetical protein